MKTTCDKCSRVIEDCDGRWVGGLAILCNQCGTKDGSKGGCVSDAMTNLQKADMRLNFAARDAANASDRIQDGDDAMRELTKAKAKIENEKGGGS